MKHVREDVDRIEVSRVGFGRKALVSKTPVVFEVVRNPHSPTLLQVDDTHWGIHACGNSLEEIRVAIHSQLVSNWQHLVVDGENPYRGARAQGTRLRGRFWCYEYPEDMSDEKVAALQSFSQKECSTNVG